MEAERGMSPAGVHRSDYDATEGHVNHVGYKFHAVMAAINMLAALLIYRLGGIWEFSASLALLFSLWAVRP